LSEFRIRFHEDGLYLQCTPDCLFTFFRIWIFWFFWIWNFGFSDLDRFGLTGLDRFGFSWIGFSSDLDGFSDIAVSFADTKMHRSK